MKPKFDLRIGDGIGPLKFGMNQAEVLDIMGVPVKRDVSRDSANFEYYGEDLWLNFFGYPVPELNSIDFYLNEIYYKDEQIIGKPKEYMLATVFPEIVDWEITDDEGDYEEYFCRDKWLSLVFVENLLDSVHLVRLKEKPKTLIGKIKAWWYDGY